MSAVNIEVVQKKFQCEVETMKKIQKQYQKLVSLNQALETQLNENMMVKEELALARSDSKVFKMVGSVLVPQRYADAKENVDQRVKYIELELRRNSDSLEKVRGELVTQKDILGTLEKIIIDHQAKMGTQRPQK